ncbi:hypothetical protein AAY473_008298, partial [Plecturocebus cupreus]
MDEVKREHFYTAALWEVEVGGSSEVTSSRIAWSTKKLARQWHVPIIQATWEAEARESLELRSQRLQSTAYLLCPIMSNMVVRNFNEIQKKLSTNYTDNLENGRKYLQIMLLTNEESTRNSNCSTRKIPTPPLK